MSASPEKHTGVSPEKHAGRWKLTLEYDGTPFAGWQKQNNAFSVQEALEKAITAFCGETVQAHVAGRTDAGVHATGQVAHIDLARETDEKTVRDAINFHLRPHPVAVVKAERASPEFHARFGATYRTYCYKILMGRRADTVLLQNRAWHLGRDLDVAKMNKAAQYLLGTHDFSSFRDAECQAKSPIRSLDRLEFIENRTELSAGRMIELRAEARSFLHHQIRNFTGTLVLVGEGKWQPEDVKTALEAKDRTKAGPTAPPHGLYFTRVDYPEQPLQRVADSLL
ncbi:MAG: tRNA pseudouridine(38-40) synthase TruA [Micavibrio sp.]|nr:tRNA pseudouridine(38-40) synthase TruA [Micavibrio sp.]